MIVSILAFFCGILSLQFLPFLPSLRDMVVVCFLAIAAVIGRFCIAAPYKKICFCLVLVAIFLLGFLYAALLAKLVARWQLPLDLVGKNIIVTGYVSSLPATKMSNLKFHFATESVAGVKRRAKLLLSWYGKERPHIAAGEKWQLVVRLKRPRGMVNPGGFDYEKYLWQQHVRATGYVLPDPATKKIFLNHIPLRYFILVWRQNVEDKISQVLTQQPLLGMINALVLGDQSGVTKMQWSTFRDTGTSYLMAIAGLHICLAAGVVLALVYFLWCRSSRLALWMPAKQAAALCGLVAAMFYSILSGFSIPTQRALIMLSVFVLALLSQRNADLWHVLCIALLVVLLLDPFSVLAVGFWLSFIAVTLIFYVTSGRLQLSHVYWRKYSRMQGAITLGLAPFTLAFFSQASLITFVANIFALPGVCLIVVPLSLLGSLLLLLWVDLGKYVLLLAEKIMEIIYYGLKWLAFYQGFNWQQHIFAWWQVAFTIVGVFLLLAPRGFCGKFAGVIWLCPLLFCEPAKPTYGEVWFSLLDVGEGLAAVVQTQYHALIYDTGPKFSDSDVGESVVVPFLQTAGIAFLDTMVISHGDDDHSGGAASILRLMPVGEVITSMPEKFPEVAAQKCYAGQKWQWDGVSFHMLYPPVGMPYAGNKSSCVLRVDNGKNSILLVGDIGRGEEKFLLRENRGFLSSSLLVVAHHGSAKSSSPDFVNEVNAQYALFSAGYVNRFHFPAASVLKRFQQQGAKILQTKDSGTIAFKLAKEQNILFPSLYRATKRRYWYSAVD